MKYVKNIAVVLALGLIQLSTSSLADEPKPSISLFGFDGDNSVVQAKGDPLLLHIVVGNAHASSQSAINQRNERHLKELENSELATTLSEKELETLKQTYATKPVPRFKLGSAKDPINSFFNFQIRANDGSVVNLKPRMLSKFEDQVNYGDLGEDDRFYYVFVIESGLLTGRPDGDFSIAVGIDTQNKKDMWQGWAHSNVLKLSLASSHPDSNWEGSEDQASMFAYYLINDKHFELAEFHAYEWTQKHPLSIDAFSYLGDALAGLDQVEKALEAYYKAAKNFTLKHGKNPVEIPRTLVAQIDALEELGENTQ